MDHKLCKDCKGYCCEDIGLPVPPEQIKNSYHTWIDYNIARGKVSLSMTYGTPANTDLYQGIHLIYPMLVFTHKDKTHPDGEIVNDDYIYHYRCKHHNQKTHNCDIYDERPMMCRTFPDSGFCGYRSVDIDEVILLRPEWFEFGMTADEWTEAKYNRSPSEPSEDKLKEDAGEK